MSGLLCFIKASPGVLFCILATEPSACTDERAARQFRPQSSSVARVGLAEERTEEFPKRARVSQPACVNRQNSADTDPPRLRKYSWHKRCDQKELLSRGISLLHWQLGLLRTDSHGEFL